MFCGKSPMDRLHCILNPIRNSYAESNKHGSEIGNYEQTDNWLNESTGDTEDEVNNERIRKGRAPKGGSGLFNHEQFLETSCSSYSIWKTGILSDTMYENLDPLDYIG